jgi:ADP-heptose:LPS heptosyltransferase
VQHTTIDAFGSPSLSRLDGVRRIAALRANALGDLLVALPALQSVKAAYPEAELVLLGLDWHRGFLEGRPGPVDRVIVLPPVRGVSTPDHEPAPAEPPPAFLAAAQAERFDLALQLHGGGRYSNPFVRRLGARLTAGLRALGSEPLDRWARYVYFQPEVLRYLEVAALVGAPPVTLQGRVMVTGADLEEANAALRWAGAPDTGRLVAIHPGAGDPRRRWPAERFARVADELAGGGATVTLTGTAGERPLTAAVAAAMRHPAADLAGRLSLGGLAGLLARCALVIGNDTGPLHLARAVGAATVTIYWVGNLFNSGPVGRAHHRSAVSWTLSCPVCGMLALEERCEHDPSFVTSVPVEAVLDEALDLLSTSLSDVISTK